MASKEDDMNQLDEENNSFGPPKAPLLKRLESTEYFEGCSDPEKVFGANLSKIMASFALQSNDDINIADLATPKAQYMYPSQSIDTKLDISAETSAQTRTGENAFASPRRHSSIHFTNPLDEEEFDRAEAPGNFLRTRYNSRSYGGVTTSFGGDDFNNGEFTVPTNMIGSQSRFSGVSSKRRVTLDGIEKSPSFNLIQHDIAQELMKSNFEQELEEIEGSGNEDEFDPHQFSNQNIHYQEPQDASRRGSRRHSSPPRRHSQLLPGEKLLPNAQGQDIHQIGQMDVNAAPFQPNHPQKWYPPEGYKNREQYNAAPNQPMMPKRATPSSPVARPPIKKVESPLQHFKVTAQRPNTNDLIGHVLEFSKDSQGSRVLQQKMDMASAGEKKLLIDEVLDDLVDLACHPFGNYVVQNFLQHATEQQLILLGENFLGNTQRVSNDNHGCRAVQFALEILPLGTRNKIIDEICDNIVAISKNSHGTHVVQKCLSYLTKEALYAPKAQRTQWEEICRGAGVPSSTDLLRKIEGKVLSEFLRLAIHPYSYRLIQFTLADCNESRSETLKKILKKIKDNYQALALDQHGNFILQHILDRGTSKQKASVQSFVCDKVLMLSQHKFASHLVEKSLTTASPNEVAGVVQQILKPTKDNASYLRTHVADGHTTALLLLSKDPYANFVVQKAYKYAPMPLKKSLGAEISKYSEELSRYNYGRHILSRVKN